MRILRALNKLRWPLRAPIKSALFVLTLLVVCFPYPNRLITHLRRWRDPNVLIEPGAAALEPFILELTPQVPADMAPEDILLTVQRFVYEKISYDWDWNTWGVADYVPTVTEAITQGREDCDGRAVVAASLLTHFGLQAQLVSDFAHVWVYTDFGETMGPGRRKAVVATEEGVKLRPGALIQTPNALGLGIAVFPLIRELIILVVLWVLLLRPQDGGSRNLIMLVLLVVGLMLLRAGGRQYGHPVEWLQLLGLAVMLAGLSWLPVRARIKRRRASIPSE